jgi:hypothetical protein
MINVLRIDHRSVTAAVSESWTSRAGCSVIDSACVVRRCRRGDRPGAVSRLATGSAALALRLVE